MSAKGRGMTRVLGWGHRLEQIVSAQKAGRAEGICSVCSSNRYVLEAAIEQALAVEGAVLIESTCNQVNQYGGYSGMKPVDFVAYVHRLAQSVGLPSSRMILGGDHLGPFPFRQEPAAVAMAKSREMVRQYVLSGYTKIHLDTSMRLGDDPGGDHTALDPRVIAERCADLCSVAEAAYQELRLDAGDVTAPMYVIGTEVPAPGGSDEVEEGLAVTRVSDLGETISVTQEAFERRGLDEAWQRVVAVVVQPGVEYGDHTVVDYDRQKAESLTRAIRDIPQLVFEGHSTDYQTEGALKELVEDGVAILKVGPALTFAVREMVFALSYMEEELLGHQSRVVLSRFRDTLDRTMVRNPQHWQGYYSGTESQLAIARRYSLFDRARYYWGEQEVVYSLERLIRNLRSVDIPLPLISQFLPRHYDRVRRGLLSSDAEALIRAGVSDVLRTYAYAVGEGA